MLATEKGRSRWVKCPNCGHKLFRVFSDEPMMLVSIGSLDGTPYLHEGSIEIKCHSCKKIVVISEV